MYATDIEWVLKWLNIMNMFVCMKVFPCIHIRMRAYIFIYMYIIRIMIKFLNEEANKTFFTDADS